MGAPSLGDVAEAPEDKPPLMVDLFCGPNLPLGKAFLYCGWRCLPVDWALDPSHDLSNPQRQDSIREQLQDAVFAAAALDCSTKSRAREMPRDLGDGKLAQGPRPLRLCPDRAPDRGGGSVRENPLRSLHCELTQEKQMMATGPWQDTVYYACCFMADQLRVSIATTPTQPTSGSLTFRQRVFPSKEEAEYTASLAFGIAVSASWWAARMGLAKLHGFPFGKPRAGGNIGCRLIPGPSGSGQRSGEPSSDTRGGRHLGRQDLATWGRLCGTRPP